MNEGGRFPFLVFLAANVKAWTFGSANGVLKPKIELGTSRSKLKEHGVLPWWWRSWSPLRGAGAASSSHGLFRYTDKSRNKTCVSCVSGFAGDSLPTEPLGKQSVYMNKFGKTVLNIFFDCLTRTVPWLWGIPPDMIFYWEAICFLIPWKPLHSPCR